MEVASSLTKPSVPKGTGLVTPVLGTVPHTQTEEMNDEGTNEQLGRKK